MKLYVYVSTNKIEDNLLEKINVNCNSCKLKNDYDKVIDLGLNLLGIESIIKVNNKSIFEITFQSTLDCIIKNFYLLKNELNLQLTLNDKILDWEFTTIENSYDYFISRD